MNLPCFPGVSLRHGLTFSLGVFALLLQVCHACADDVTTLSGTTLRQVRVVRVEPDGVIWQHATGICKVDFTDLPERVRRAFRYDPAKAAAYHDAQQQAHAQAIERDRRILQEAEQRRSAHLEVVATDDPASPGAVRANFIYHLSTDSGPMAAAARSLEEQIAAKNAPHAAHDRMGVTDAQVLEDLGKPGALRITPRSTDSTRDPFFSPEYSTRAYYEGIQRAEAFARGHP